MRTQSLAFARSASAESRHSLGGGGPSKPRRVKRIARTIPWSARLRVGIVRLRDAAQSGEGDAVSRITLGGDARQSGGCRVSGRRRVSARRGISRGSVSARRSTLTQRQRTLRRHSRPSLIFDLRLRSGRPEQRRGAFRGVCKTLRRLSRIFATRDTSPRGAGAQRPRGLPDVADFEGRGLRFCETASSRDELHARFRLHECRNRNRASRGWSAIRRARRGFPRTEQEVTTGDPCGRCASVRRTRRGIPPLHFDLRTQSRSLRPAAAGTTSRAARTRGA